MDRIDASPQEIPSALCRRSDAAKNAGQKVGNKLEEAGQKIKEKSE